MNTPTPRTKEIWGAMLYTYPYLINCVTETGEMEAEVTAVTEQRDGLRWGIDYASDQLTKVTEQRDRLAEALRKIKNAGGTYTDAYDELDFIDGVTYEALQSLDQP